MSLSEENARLQSELESLRSSPPGGVGKGLTNGDASEDVVKLQSHVQELTAHVSCRLTCVFFLRQSTKHSSELLFV